MKLMKKTAIAATCFALFSAQAYAGGMAEPMMEPEVIVEESSASSGGFIIPLMLLALLVVIISDDDPVPAGPLS